MILVRNIRLPLSAGEPQAFEKALHAARIPRGKVQHLGVAKLSVDARHGQPKLVYTVAVTLKEPAEEAAFAARCGDASLQQKVDFSVQNGIQPLAHRPVVCGLGPAGLFAALLLARQGYQPIVLERGPALDERVKAVEHFSATGELDVNANIQFGEGGDASLQQKVDFSVQNGIQPLAHRPVVCGLGPAGLFAALLLARQGYQPIVLERGPALDERVKAVEHFSATGELDVNANIQFGEGGAGTFSDGKLTTRIGDELCGFVTEVFLQHGAPEEIAWKQKPHVGTDLLRGVITSIRKEIEALGGEVHFNTALTGFEQKNGRLTGIFTTNGTFACEALVFAVGHSARDTFGMLMDGGLQLECKPFSVGFRAEHLQSEIEKSLYHEAAGHPALPRGEYQLSQHVGERCVYTFCMCPGGQVVASASEEGRVVTNGMSFHARNGKNANAAVVVSVGGKDFADDPCRAIAFQRELEAKAYAAGRSAGEYAAPAENIQSFLEGRGQLNIGRVQPTYDRGVAAADLGALLPQELAETLRAGLRAYERKIAGYTAPEAILTGLETRTSSPVRLKREENFECTQLAGLYPCGEGAGYAGGIMSAAVDGLRVARAIISRYAPAEG